MISHKSGRHLKEILAFKRDPTISLDIFERTVIAFSGAVFLVRGVVEFPLEFPLLLLVLQEVL